MLTQVTGYKSSFLAYATLLHKTYKHTLLSERGGALLQDGLERLCLICY